MHLFGRHIYRTAFGTAHVRDIAAPDGGAVRVLAVGGVYQGATWLDEQRFEPVFSYHRAFDLALGEPHSPAARVLAIGGGGYAWPKHVLAAFPEAQLDVVEVDPAITRIAQRHFFLDDAVERFDPKGRRLRLICEDGRAFLEQHATVIKGPERSADPPAPTYTAIVNDTFSGRAPARTLATLEAAQTARSCLAPGGVYAANVVAEGDGEDLTFLRDVVATLRQAFAHVHVIPCPDDDFGGADNYLVAATDDDRPFPGAVPYDADFPGTVLRDA